VASRPKVTDHSWRDGEQKDGGLQSKGASGDVDDGHFKVIDRSLPDREKGDGDTCQSWPRMAHQQCLLGQEYVAELEVVGTVGGLMLRKIVAKPSGMVLGSLANPN